jgi:hypothetical protein
VKGDVVLGHVVHARLGPRHQRENRQRSSSDVVVEHESADELADLGVVPVVMTLVLARAHPHAAPREPPAARYLDAQLDVAIQPRGLGHRLERRLEGRPRVEQRGREHVAGDAAEGVEMNVHDGSFYQPIGTPTSGALAPLSGSSGHRV